MVGESFDINEIVSPEDLARKIANQHTTWESLRAPEAGRWKERRNFIFATDTSTTSAGSTPWKNNTTLAKMTQIRDNLHANYLGALFPNNKWLLWEAYDRDAATKAKRDAIQFYMENKTRESKFTRTMSNLVLDYIDYGNCFALVDYEENKTTVDGEEISGYVGPVVKRISPYDITFNPTASDFRKTPKIIRVIKSLGEIKKMIATQPEMGYLEGIFERAMESRSLVRSTISQADTNKSAGFQADGFGGIENYYQSDYAELLFFFGDLYDDKTQTLLENQQITVIDRSFILQQKTNPSWNGRAPIFHAGWRKRPDNLYSMGPLDNLVGMQYMIDKLQNAKADIYDQIIHPTKVIKGEVLEPDHDGPGATYYADADGDVRFLPPDASALSADNQIAILEQKMEELAGAPKQKMGFRTPGEKTKFEVQVLDNASNRIFLHATSQFEEEFEEPILNEMLATGRRLMSSNEVIKLQSSDFNAEIFQTITKEDITAKGNLKPVGARHFAEKANKLQEIVQVFNSGLMQDPAVKVHTSGLGKARLMEEFLDLKQFNLVSKNIGVLEAQETQRLSNAAEEDLEVEAQMPSPEEFA